MQPIITAHVLVFNDKNQVLLVRHGASAGHITGVYGIPGGRLNPNEQLIDAAIRELHEETGLSVTKKDLHTFPDNQYSASIKRKDGTEELYRMYIYVTGKYSGSLMHSDETVPEWVAVKDVYSMKLLPNVAKAVVTGFDHTKKI